MEKVKIAEIEFVNGTKLQVMNDLEVYGCDNDGLFKPKTIEFFVDQWLESNAVFIKIKTNGVSYILNKNNIVLINMGV